MVRPGRDQLTGEVEVDETYVGGVGTKIRGRGAKRKTIVAIAAEVRGRGPGRIRMAKIPDLSAPSLRRFVRDNVQRGAELRTDGWSGYNGIEVMGYRHTVINISDIATYVEMGRMEEARAEAEELLRIDPKWTSKGSEKTSPLKDPQMTHRRVEAWRKVGLERDVSTN
jgi:hypothetical protein